MLLTHATTLLRELIDAQDTRENELLAEIARLETRVAEVSCQPR